MTQNSNTSNKFESNQKNRRNPYDLPVEQKNFKISEDDEFVRWCFSALENQWSNFQNGCSPFGNYYEFGVGWGGTLSRYLKALDKFCKIYKSNPNDFHVFAFDSFEGPA